MATYSKELNVVIINQNNNNLIPFTFIGEPGISVDLKDDSKIAFIVEPSNTKSLDYTAIIERNNEALTGTQFANETVYVPEDPRSFYEHRSQIYVDIIGNDESGINEVRTHVEPNKYQFEEVVDSFLIPKFTWDNSIVSSNTITTTTTGFIDGSFWTGTEDATFHKIKFGSNAVSIVYSANVSSDVTGMLFATNTSKFYISTATNLYSYSVDAFLEGISVGQNLAISNYSGDVVNFYDTNVWSTQAYGGNIRSLDPLDLSQKSIISGFDAPFKVIKSEFHDVYFVAGDHIVWKIDGGVVTAFYEINDYAIIDFAVSENGRICLLLSGTTEDIIRVLDYDLYTFLLDKRITDSKVRYCKYCLNGRFYILSEIAGSDISYVSHHYLFDINTGSLSTVISSEALVETTTTTTIGATTKPVEILYPNGDEILQIGKSYTIKWLSDKALNDFVKIELYKGGSFYSLISESTQNTGIYVWEISSFIPEETDYKISITWLSANNDPANTGISSAEFSILQTVPVTTTTTTMQIITETAIGVDYDVDRNYIVFVLRSGLFGIYDLEIKAVYGLYNTGLRNLSAMAIGDDFIGEFDKQTKVRVFVGSKERTSDMWDSGEITTSLTSIYYGGKPLIPGKKYYVNVQVYSEKYGWSEIQTKEFIMPKGT